MNRTNWLVLETAGRGDEFATAGRVAPQRQYVPHPQRTDLAQQIPNLLLGGVYAGQVRDRRQTVFALDAVHDHQRLFARAPARPVRHRAKIRPGLEQGRDGLFQERAIAFFRLGRKELEGNHRLPRGAFGRIYVSNKLHGGSRCANPAKNPSRKRVSGHDFSSPCPLLERRRGCSVDARRLG